MRPTENTPGLPEDETLTPLFVPVPTGLAEFLGYRADRRYLAFFWSEEANEVVLTDGCNRSVGQSLRFLEYLGHRNVEGELGDLNIGLFGQPASVWLVLDRQARNLHYAPIEAAQRLLAEQHRAERIEAGRLDFSSLCADMLDEEDPDLDRLVEELDRWPQCSAPHDGE